MLTNQQLIDSFALNLRVIKLQTEGLTHEASLIQAPYNINCLNWVIGHILEGRDRLLMTLGAEPLMSETERKRYARESEPVREDGHGVIRLERMLQMLEQGQERLAAALASIPPEDWQKDIQIGQHQMSLSQRVHFIYFHDTYHVGQTDMLRQLAGKNDKVI